MRGVILSLVSALPLWAGPSDSRGPDQILGVPMQILALMTALTVLPAVIMSLTPFLRIVIVLHFLRQALGTQSTPSNQVLTGLSLFLALLIVQPTGVEIYNNAWVPMEKGEISGKAAWDRAQAPAARFLARYVREKDVELFVKLSGSAAPKSAKDLGIEILAPAYILSELKAGFQIGAVLFLPFLILDLVVASLTLSIGMVQLPPAMISAPFKIMLFVLIDGWNLLIGSLVKSF
ncbi:hypothetical protein F183_A43490 [Bryobacterales bacterium F-183]|nr:hypothetical protein F183_A43490 [Bryobacterales bacterium F-183]